MNTVSNTKRDDGEHIGIADAGMLWHPAVFDYGDIPRRLHRAGIAGPVPV